MPAITSLIRGILADAAFIPRRECMGTEEVGSYVTSLQFLPCQQYVHRRECMGKNKDVARTKQNEGQGCFVGNKSTLGKR